MLARARQALDHAPAARLLPHPLESKRRTDPPSRNRCRFSAVERVEHDRLVGEARARAQKPLQPAVLLQILDPPERGDHLLAHRGALASAFDNLQIGAAAGGLLAEIHSREGDIESVLVRTISACNPKESTKILAKRGTTFSQFVPFAPNHIKGLRSARMPQVLKISLR